MKLQVIVTICLLLATGVALLIVGSQEGGERTQAVIDSYRDGGGTADWRDAQVAARVQPTNWILITGGVLILLVWVSTIKRGVVAILRDQ